MCIVFFSLFSLLFNKLHSPKNPSWHMSESINLNKVDIESINLNKVDIYIYIYRYIIILLLLAGPAEYIHFKA
jgi:hypothetical protein